MSNGQSRQKGLKRLENFTKGKNFFNNNFNLQNIQLIALVILQVLLQHSTYRTILTLQAIVLLTLATQYSITIEYWHCRKYNNLQYRLLTLPTIQDSTYNK